MKFKVEDGTAKVQAEQQDKDALHATASSAYMRYRLLEAHGHHASSSRFEEVQQLCNELLRYLGIEEDVWQEVVMPELVFAQAAVSGSAFAADGVKDADRAADMWSGVFEKAAAATDEDAIEHVRMYGTGPQENSWVSESDALEELAEE